MRQPLSWKCEPWGSFSTAGQPKLGGAVRIGSRNESTGEEMGILMEALRHHWKGDHFYLENDPLKAAIEVQPVPQGHLRHA